MTPPCPPDHLLRSLREDDLDSEGFAELEQHVESCPACAGRLESMGRRFSTEASSPPILAEGVPAPRIPGFVIECELGRGGMGVVYRARQQDVDRTVAIKVLPGADARRRRRWLNEARAAALVSHANVVQIHTVGEAEAFFYLVLEHVAGGSLKDLAAGPMRPRRAAETIRDVARTVSHFHANGLVHLDLKPANILVDEATGRPVPKVADFGLARMTAAGPAGDFTRDGVRGTPSYMAPEQTAGDGLAIGEPADVYALGATLYHLITGRPPFLAGSDHRTMEEVRSLPPVSPRRLAPGIPVDLETITLKCLEKSPAGRYTSAGAVAEDLDRWLEGRPIQARPIPMLRRAWLSARLRPRLVAACVALGIGLAAVPGDRTGFRRSDDPVSAEVARELAILVDVAEDQAYRWAPFRWERFEPTVDLIRGCIRRLPPGSDAITGQMVVRLTELEGITAGRLVEVGRFADADALTRERLDLIRSRAEEIPGNAWRRRVVAGAFIDAAAVDRANGDARSALDHLDRAVEVATASAEDFEACRSLGLRTSAEYAQLRDDLTRAGDGGGAVRALSGLERSRGILTTDTGGRVDAELLKACALADGGEWRLARDLAASLLLPGHDWCFTDCLIHQSAHEAVAAWTRRQALHWTSRLDREDFDPTGGAIELDRDLRILNGLRTRGGLPRSDVGDAIREAMATRGTDLRRVGRIDEAERTAAAMRAIARAYVRLQPGAPASALLMAEAYAQESKNARCRGDAQAIRRGLEAAVGTIREAVSLAPQDDALWAKLKILSARLAELPEPVADTRDLLAGP